MKELLNCFENLHHIPTHLLDNNCFACGKNNPEGLHMQFYTDDKKYVFSKVYMHETKRGWEQVVHGGITSTILDEIMGWTAIYFTKQFMLTKTINVSYLNPVTIKSTIKAVGWIEKSGDKEIIMKAQIYDETNKLCAESIGNFALFSKKLAKRLKIMSEETIDQFDNFINAASSK